VAGALTARGEATRARIVEATADLLAEGVGDPGLDAISARTSTSRSQLFHYFPGGKAEVVRVATERLGARSLAEQAPASGGLDSWEAWERWRENIVERFGRPPDELCAVGALYVQAGTDDPATHEVVVASYEEQRAMYAEGIARMRERGLLRPEVDPDALALGLVAALQGGVVLQRALGSRRPLEAALDAALGALRRYAT
jgi:AcrR family transcriptional regulator